MRIIALEYVEGSSESIANEWIALWEDLFIAAHDFPGAIRIKWWRAARLDGSAP